MMIRKTKFMEINNYNNNSASYETFNRGAVIYQNSYLPLVSEYAIWYP